MKKVNQVTLRSYQRKKFQRYKKLLNIAGLDPKIVNEIAVSDPTATVPVLNLMIDQVIRSTVVLEYTFVDEQLNYTLNRHFFDRGNKYRAARRTSRFRTFQVILQNLYILQKLSIVQSFKEVPKDIRSKICALNDLRNGMAHTFFIKGLRESKRTYQGKNIYSPNGLEQFMSDMHKVRTFFWPWLNDEEAK